MKTPAKKSGFTLIEIVIVLAIAALIVVIVFAAVAGAQRSRRDTDRKSAANQALASVQQYYSANNNTGPSANALTSYINTLKEPSTNGAYTVTVVTATPSTIAQGTIYIGQGGCTGNALSFTGTGWAAVFYQENGTQACVAIQ